MAHVMQARKVDVLFNQVVNQLSNKLMECGEEEVVFAAYFTEWCNSAEALQVFGMCVTAFPQYKPSFYETKLIDTPWFHIVFRI